ncbi:hypothetical protein HanIR_Chr09g0398611 [Helianthus annuus]|nr:hypothetical protein HanIR_Chr09g0398611 [Helianthus annuus]
MLFTPQSYIHKLCIAIAYGGVTKATIVTINRVNNIFVTKKRSSSIHLFLFRTIIYNTYVLFGN